MVPSGYPPGWEADYDGDTERWFYIHKPSGVRQYHFPRAGDEVELAAALARSKAGKEIKSEVGNSAKASNNVGFTDVTPSTAGSQSTDTPAAPDTASDAANSSSSPSAQPLRAERGAVIPASSGTQQNIPNAFKQTFQTAQQNDGNEIKHRPLQQPSQIVLPPLDTQFQNAPRLPYHVPSSAHPLHGNTNSLSLGNNASPVQSMSAGPWSFSGSKSSSGGLYFSDSTQHKADSSIPVANPTLDPAQVVGSDQAPAAATKDIDQTHKHASSVPHSVGDEILLARLDVLSLSIPDKEVMMRNLQVLGRIYPNVTFSQFVDSHTNMPPANSSGLPDTPEPTQTTRDASVKRAPIITEDASLPIAFVAYSREPQRPVRSQTSPVVHSPIYGSTAPSFNTSFGLQSHRHSSSIASTSTIQAPRDVEHASNFGLKQQESIGMQTNAYQARTELPETDWTQNPNFIVKGPKMTTNMPAGLATTVPIQQFQSFSDMVTGTLDSTNTGSQPMQVNAPSLENPSQAQQSPKLTARPTRQRSVNRKPLSNQSPIVTRPNRSLSWQPHERSPNLQLPSSLVAEEPEEFSALDTHTSITQVESKQPSSQNLPHIQQSQTAALPNQESIAAPLQRQTQDNVEVDLKEFDRLNSIIKEQNKQLLLLYQQNVQNLQSLQNQQNVTVAHQSQQFGVVGDQPHASATPTPSARSSIYIQASLQNAQYPPGFPSVPVSPISRPQSLVYSVQHEQLEPLSLPEPIGTNAADNLEEIGRIVEANSHTIDVFKGDTKITANISQDSPDNYSNRAIILDAGIVEGDVEQETRASSNETADQSVEPVEEIALTEAAVEGSNDSHEPLLAEDDPRPLTNTTEGSGEEDHPIQANETPQQPEQYDAPQIAHADENQSQPAQSSQGQTESAAYEINMQKALEAQIQQHLEAVVSPPLPPDPAQTLNQFSSDSAVSDMSTPGLVHHEYFDSVSIRNSQVTTQKRLSGGSSRPVSIEAKLPGQDATTKQPSVNDQTVPKVQQFYEEKQTYFPEHAPLKLHTSQNTEAHDEGFTEQRMSVLIEQTEIFTSPRPVVTQTDGFKTFDASGINRQGQFIAFSRPKESGSSLKENAPLKPTVVDIVKPISDNNTTKMSTQPPGPIIPESNEQTNESAANTQPYNAYAQQTPPLDYGKPEDIPQPQSPPPPYLQRTNTIESLYDGDGYGDYSDDDEPQFAPLRVLQVRRT